MGSYCVSNEAQALVAITAYLFGFKVTTSRAISAQIFRHRSLNFQETSQRYEEIPSHEEIELRMEHPTNRQKQYEYN
jgi:thymidylate synthase ThyX